MGDPVASLLSGIEILPSSNPSLSLARLVSLKNDPLPETEAAIVRIWLLAAEMGLAYIEYSMGRLQLHPDPEAPLEQTMQRLDIRRRKLLEPLTAYRLALAPHKVLSDDVLREIFIRCAYDDPSDPFYFGPNLRTRFRWFTPDEGSALDVRLVLSSVCSKWRSVALATHEI
ncbi:hypothetical protein B0H11DRAFT_232767 [Mycena galericulata]|nr:hypothetical protein B0H11DRAFT_232767 [Mycena galericulata]